MSKLTEEITSIDSFEKVSEAFSDFLEKNMEIKGETIGMLKKIIKPFTFKKNQKIAVEGSPVNAFYFIPKGAVVYSKNDFEGISRNMYFDEGPCLATSFRSLIQDSLCDMDIVTTHAGIGGVVEWAAFKEFVADNADGLYCYSKFIEKAYLDLAVKKVTIVPDSIYDRYISFVEKYPGLETKIPRYHIASYIGCTSQSLSKLIKSV